MTTSGIQMNQAKTIRSELKSLSDPAKAEFLARFFKTGKGEYGEGDRFLGIVVPKIRKVANAHRSATETAVLDLLSSDYHEERLVALLILVEQYRRGNEKEKQRIFDLYLANTAHINSWDLVDLTAQHIVGDYLSGRNRAVLAKLARSRSLWERRISILATYHFIRRGESAETLLLAELLLHDPQDLIHKAVGWMLREVGKRCSVGEECSFLEKHASEMPRTMLRYAIERFPPEIRKRYMNAESAAGMQKPKKA
jgi:3-methyladenine DNA glycosylase AlkD